MNTATCVGQQGKKCKDPLSSSSKRPTLHDILPVISMYWTVDIQQLTKHCLLLPSVTGGEFGYDT